MTSKFGRVGTPSRGFALFMKWHHLTGGETFFDFIFWAAENGHQVSEILDDDDIAQIQEITGEDSAEISNALSSTAWP